MRLIDADALIESIKNTADLGGWVGEALYQIKQVAVKYIDSTPTIEPKRGEWIRDMSSPIAYKCTACNTLQHWSVIQDGGYHFCPNCGADMGKVRKVSDEA